MQSKLTNQIDNGNPIDHTSMKSNRRNAFNGLALAVIQSTSKAGNILIKVSSPGLKDASVELTTKNLKAPLMTVENLK